MKIALSVSADSQTPRTLGRRKTAKRFRCGFVSAHLLQHVTEGRGVQQIVAAAPRQLERRLGIVTERRQVGRRNEDEQLRRHVHDR